MEIENGCFNTSRKILIKLSNIFAHCLKSSVTFPPDLLVRIGGAGRYTVGNVDSGYISLQGEAIETMGKMELSSSCPACKHDYAGSEDQLCPSCGSSRPMVEE